MVFLIHIELRCTVNHTSLHIHSPTQHRTALPIYKHSKVKTQNRYFILDLDSCKKGPDKSHSSFVGFYFHTFSSNGFTVFSHQFTFHTAFHTALKKDITLLTTENHYLGSLRFMVFFILCLREFSVAFFRCRCRVHFKIRFGKKIITTRKRINPTKDLGLQYTLVRNSASKFHYSVLVCLATENTARWVVYILVFTNTVVYTHTHIFMYTNIWQQVNETCTLIRYRLRFLPL